MAYNKKRMGMMTMNVGAGGDFLSIGEALLAVPYNEAGTLTVAPGVYREKVFCEKRDITIRGAGVGQTVLTFDDGGKQSHPDGRKKGTFRSYTAFFGGGRVTVEDMTIENSAGDGRVVGQALAVYADAAEVCFRNVHLIGRQDTLFCGPLPEKEREAGGFFGPRNFSPRVMSRQRYENCRIEGDVDFIFGGADAVFERCDIVSLDRGEAINGYVAAPSGFAGGEGFVFRDCRFLTDGCADGTVYLARPWRPEGKAAFIRCEFGRHIRPEFWAKWTDDDRPTFVTTDCVKAGGA